MNEKPYRWISPYHSKVKTADYSKCHVGKRLTDRKIDEYVRQGKLGNLAVYLKVRKQIVCKT